jgi:hypothetical protein
MISRRRVGYKNSFSIFAANTFAFESSRINLKVNYFSLFYGHRNILKKRLLVENKISNVFCIWQMTHSLAKGIPSGK